MSKSNGRAMTWAKHNEALGGRLQEVINAIQRIPGIVERNERRLEALAERRRAVMDVLSPKPEPKAEDQLSTRVGNP